MDTFKVKNQTIVSKAIETIIWTIHTKIIFLATSAYQVSDVDNQN